MEDISTIIAKIRTEVTLKSVRTAIADALEYCYANVAGTTRTQESDAAMAGWISDIRTVFDGKEIRESIASGIELCYNSVAIFAGDDELGRDITDSYLQQIRTAVFGKDARESIASAIEYCLERWNNIPVGSASGPIVSFDDGTGLPFKTLSVAVEPVQDLHGYDSPWPAGGGKNLFGGEYGTKWLLPTPLSISAGDQLAISASVPASGNSRINIYTGENGATRYFNAGLNDTVNGRKVRIATFTEDITITAFLMDVAECTDIQIEKGSTATTFAPYSNDCPITGHTAVTVTRTGKNLVDLSRFADEYPMHAYMEDDVLYVAPQNSSLYSNGIVANIKSTASGFYCMAEIKTGTATNARIRFVMEDGYFAELGLGSTTEWTKYSVQIAASHGELASVRMNWSQVGSFMIRNLCVNDFDADFNGTYVEPDIQSVTLQLGQTVYGGIPDTVAGKLRVDRAIVDLGSLNWSYNANWGGAGAFYCNTAPAGIKTDNPTTAVPNALCTTYATYARDYLYGNPGATGFCIPNNTAQVSIRDARYTDAASFKTAVTGVQLVYELATPTELTLTPQEIHTLLGANNIWSDAGDVTAEWHRDTTEKEGTV